MYITVYLFAKMLGLHIPNPTLYFREQGFEIWRISQTNDDLLFISDAICFAHATPARLQVVMAYKPENLYEKTKQDELLCRCDL